MGFNGGGGGGARFVAAAADAPLGVYGGGAGEPKEVGTGGGAFLKVLEGLRDGGGVVRDGVTDREDALVADRPKLAAPVPRPSCSCFA